MEMPVNFYPSARRCRQLIMCKGGSGDVQPFAYELADEGQNPCDTEQTFDLV
jgi:hypothetical protein